MKSILYILLFSVAACSVKAQNPVNWTYSAKKTADNTFEVKLTATIDAGWHLYSQTQPADAIAIPTEIIFTKNPLLSFEGKIKEVGNLEKYHDKTLDVSANQYSRKVEFVQVVKVKGKGRTNASGTIEFQTCTDERCLPAKKINFSVTLN
ncbi:MAG: hypothetical protein B7Z54_07005 [Sphingobacteriales bacterium 12-47-4]|nr:MAG: hypothetical protein B7Z54_07005 [Sphingobacteriales bacterium 12-47-4]